MPKKLKDRVLTMTFKEYVKHREAGTLHDDVAKIAGVSIATLGRAGYGRRWKRLQHDAAYVSRHLSKDAKQERRDRINAKRAQIDTARQSVIERYGSVNDAPADSLEIEWLQKLNNDLAKMG